MTRSQAAWVVIVVAALLAVALVAGVGDRGSSPVDEGVGRGGGSAQSSMVTPTSGLGVLGALAPLLGALIAVVGVIATIIFTNRRERDRQEHERLLAHAARLRDERIAAYRKLLLAATNERPTEPEQVDEVLEALTEVQLLAGSFRLLQDATGIWMNYAQAYSKAAEAKKKREAGDDVGWAEAEASAIQSMTEMRKYRDHFLQEARGELGVSTTD